MDALKNAISGNKTNTSGAQAGGSAGQEDYLDKGKLSSC